MTKYSFLEEEKKKVLVFEHVTFSKDCAAAFEALGYEVRYSEVGSLEELITLVHLENPKYLFTINFHPMVMEVAEELEVPYIAWVVDSPYYSLFYERVKKAAPYLFIYDEAFANRLKEMGFQNVNYLPAAANIDRLTKDWQEEVKEHYDVTFVGSTGDDNEYNTFSLAKKFGPELIKEVEGIFLEQQKDEERFLIRDLVTDELVERIAKAMAAPVKEDGLMATKEKMAYILARKYNEFCRKEMLTSLSKEFSVSVWGDPGWKKIANEKLAYMGYAEHYIELPKIVRASKINLNQTRVYVDQGLPMRVFDVLGSGGFLATNRTKDIDRYFENGKDLVVFKGNQELKELTAYYLEHEKERKKIAKAGHEKVKRLHTFKQRIEEILQKVSG